MKQAEIEKTLKGLNENMLHLLREALCNGEERRQGKNKPYVSRRDCALSYGDTRYLQPALRSLKQRGLAEISHPPFLTSDGFTVAKHHMAEWLPAVDGSTIDPEPNGKFEDDYVATTVEEYVRHYLKLQADAKNERIGELKKAQRLWRGFKVKEYDGTRAMSTLIEEAYPEGESSRYQMRLSLDTLIELGEQIERLR